MVVLSGIAGTLLEQCPSEAGKGVAVKRARHRQRLIAGTRRDLGTGRDRMSSQVPTPQSRTFLTMNRKRLSLVPAVLVLVACTTVSDRGVPSDASDSPVVRQIGRASCRERV